MILALLKFADDVALMAETEKDLQWMLKALHFCVNAGYSASILAKQKLFTPDKSHSLEPVLNSNVALQK